MRELTTYEHMGISLGMVAALVGFFVFMAYDIKHSTVCETGIVIDIGGCNRDGRCGVQLLNGFVGTAYYPVKGSQFEVCRSTR